MKPSTLRTIKQQIRKVSNLYEILTDTWNGKLEHGNKATYPIMIWVKVILSNLAFDGSNCHGYDHDKAVKEMEMYIKTLKALDEYESECYITHFPYTQVNMIYEGEIMSEDYSD